MAGDVDYSVHGAGYAAQRRTDPRIARLVHDALGPARTVVNVGAGAGSYEPADRCVLAVEPSAVMRAQRPPDAAVAIDAVAEQLPLDSESVDAAMAMVTIHQWPQLARGLAEMRRVARDAVVVLTFDPDAIGCFWLARYAADLLATEQKRFPTIDAICATLGGNCSVLRVPIAADCVDGFTEAYYGRPERFLDPAVRRSQSLWGFIDEESAVAALRLDLDSGAWDQRFGHLRTEPSFDSSLRLVVSTPR